MLVKLQRNWFYEGVRYRYRDRSGGAFIQELPDSALDELPSDAQVFDEKRDLIGTAKEVRNGRSKAVKEAPVKTAEELEKEEADRKADAETKLASAKQAKADADDEVEKADAAAKAATTPGDKAKTNSALNAAKAKQATAAKALADLE